MNNKERAEATYKILQERKKKKIKKARDKFIMAENLKVDSIQRHSRARHNLKYFY